MSDLRLLALRRNLEVAESAGDEARARRIRARLGLAEEQGAEVHIHSVGPVFDEVNLEAQPVADPEVEPAQEHEDEAAERDPLEGVEFASAAARTAAAGMSPELFRGRTPSGVYGFTKADVSSIAAEADDDNPEEE